MGRNEVVLRREEESAGSSTSLETNENAGFVWRQGVLFTLDLQVLGSTPLVVASGRRAKRPAPTPVLSGFKGARACVLQHLLAAFTSRSGPQASTQKHRNRARYGGSCCLGHRFEANSKFLIIDVYSAKLGLLGADFLLSHGRTNARIPWTNEDVLIMRHASREYVLKSQRMRLYIPHCSLERRREPYEELESRMRSH